jgi:hypothetical protein
MIDEFTVSPGVQIIHNKTYTFKIPLNTHNFLRRLGIIVLIKITFFYLNFLYMLNLTHPIVYNRATILQNGTTS